MMVHPIKVFPSNQFELWSSNKTCLSTQCELWSCIFSFCTFNMFFSLGSVHRYSLPTLHIFNIV